MIVGLFGVPRVGKNTIATMIAQRELKKIKMGITHFEHVYTDFYCEGCEQISWKDFGNYKIKNSVIIFEEMGVDADARDYKKFEQRKRDALVLHGHFFNDVYYCTQNYSNVDKKIRDLTTELWYLEKSCVPFLCEFTVAKRVFRTIAINELTSELVMGYRFATPLEKIFTKCTMICFRPFYYKYFDSYDEGSLADLPEYNGLLWGEPLPV